jgi:hypothetical protein
LIPFSQRFSSLHFPHMRVLLLIAALFSATALAADPSKPHPHKGVLKPYPRPPPPLKLTDAEKARLDQGKPVMRQLEGESGGRGMAVFRVNAPPDVVWATINEFSSYPKWIDEVKKCDVYKRDGGNIDVAFRISSFPVTIDYYIHHEYDMTNRWGTWTLDYSRESDLDDSVGFWRVTPDGDDSKSLVEYSVDIKIKGWVPDFIRELLVDKGLKQATSWVKVQSEKRGAAATRGAAPTAATSAQ